MKYSVEDNRSVATTETDQEALDTFNELLLERNYGPFDENEAGDWGIKAGMTIAQLDQLVVDYANEERSERIAWRKEYNYLH